MSTRPSVPSRPIRVLLAEDEADMRHWLGDLLRAEGMEVLEAPDGHTLLEALEGYTRSDVFERPFDLVVTDHRMPGATGAAAIMVLRRYVPGLPVLLISGFADDELITRVRQAGAADVLRKPFEPGAFTRKVDAMLQEVWTVAA